MQLERTQIFGKSQRFGVKPVTPNHTKPPDQVSSIFTVPATTDNKVLHFLVDTGADVSILPYSLFQPSGGSETQKLVTANGQDIPTYGRHTIEFQFTGIQKKFKWSFILADVQRPILGSDFLAHEDITVDCKRNQISTRNHTISGSAKTCHSVTPSATEVTPALRIETNGPAIAQKPRRIGNHILSTIREEFDRLLAEGTIRRSTSSWSSPLVLVKKPDGSYRPCGDYRLLNSVTRPDSYPLPRMSDILDRISGKTVFSTLDLKKAFHQIHETDINKTAVMTFFGLFEYTTMPFGLRNASQMFQRYMDALLHGTEAFAACYIDDIIIFSDSLEQHEQHLSHIEPSTT